MDSRGFTWIHVFLVNHVDSRDSRERRTSHDTCDSHDSNHEDGLTKLTVCLRRSSVLYISEKVGGNVV